MIDNKRDSLLTDFAKTTLTDRYLLKGESYQELFLRSSKAFCVDEAHKERMYHYISKHWFMPSTPVLSNAGSDRGLPISCYLNEVQDSLESIAERWNENVWLGSNGGGIGTSWSNVRSVGESINIKGKTSGIIPFIKVNDSQTLAISQGSLRRGSAAVYLDISHPEILEFLEIRKITGDFNRKALNIHHGVTIPDAFMEAAERGDTWDLLSPVDQSVVSTTDARALFYKILETRMATGEPYMIFTDTVNRQLPEHHDKLGLRITQSNLCSEITLPTGLDHHDKNRTAVCCLGSLNLVYFDQWKDNHQFYKDCLLFLDTVLSTFISKASKKKWFESAVYSASSERSVGLGVMGLHSYFQDKNIPMDSDLAVAENIRIFSTINLHSDMVNTELGEDIGSCPDAMEVGEVRRFSYTQAIAPTASISIIAGGCSPCVEPHSSNIFIHKTLSGNFEVRNKNLVALLKAKGMNTQVVWDFIIKEKGSVQHLDCLNDHEKAVFKTAFELNQDYLVKMAVDRSIFIDQSQSLNLFLKGDVDKGYLGRLHLNAWKKGKGVKSLYYLRTKSIQRSDFLDSVSMDNTLENKEIVLDAGDVPAVVDCEACQ